MVSDILLHCKAVCHLGREMTHVYTQAAKIPNMCKLGNTWCLNGGWSVTQLHRSTAVNCCLWAIEVVPMSSGPSLCYLLCSGFGGARNDWAESLWRFMLAVRHDTGIAWASGEPVCWRQGAVCIAKIWAQDPIPLQWHYVFLLLEWHFPFSPEVWILHKSET